MIYLSVSMTITGRASQDEQAEMISGGESTRLTYCPMSKKLFAAAFKRVFIFSIRNHGRNWRERMG